jgi:hypothetical protein
VCLQSSSRRHTHIFTTCKHTYIHHTYI